MRGRHPERMGGRLVWMEAGHQTESNNRTGRLWDGTGRRLPGSLLAKGGQAEQRNEEQGHLRTRRGRRERGDNAPSHSHSGSSDAAAAGPPSP